MGDAIPETTLLIVLLLALVVFLIALGLWSFSFFGDLFYLVFFGEKPPLEANEESD